MKALVLQGIRDLELVEIDDPAIADDEVLADVLAVGICGSELEAYTGTATKRVPPLIMGHEAALAVGDDHYVMNPVLSCGVCAMCLRHQPNLCERRRLISIEKPGAYAERIAVPRSALIPIPRDLDPVVAALAEPAATALNAVDADGGVEGKRVCVIGCGSLGLLAIQIARALGAREIVAVDLLAERLAIAESLGARAVTQLGDEEQFDIVLDMVGSESTRRLAIARCVTGGAVRLTGLHVDESMLPVAQVVSRGLRLGGVYAYSVAQLETSISMLASGAIDGEALITRRPLDSGPETYAVLAADPGRWVKVVMTP